MPRSTMQEMPFLHVTQNNTDKSSHFCIKIYYCISLFYHLRANGQPWRVLFLSEIYAYNWTGFTGFSAPVEKYKKNYVKSYLVLLISPFHDSVAYPPKT